MHALSDRWGMRPQKRLGQHFLRDQTVFRKILAAAELGPGDTILEVGAGLGALTERLAAKARRVVAVEIDDQLVTVLKGKLGPLPNVDIIAGDVLSLTTASMLEEKGQPGPVPYKVVANIPYYITSALLRHLLEPSPRPQLMVLLVQKEVAQRIVAQPGKMSLLAVSVQFYGSAQLIASVPPSAFYPRPKVSSAILRIEPYDCLPLSSADIPGFFRVVRAGFGQKRKQLRNALQHGLALPAGRIGRAMRQAGIEEQRRAQMLSIHEWLALHRHLKGELPGGLTSAQDGQQPRPDDLAG